MRLRRTGPGLLLCLVLTSGCGHLKVKEHHTYVARNCEADEFTFFRVSIDGSAKHSKARYEAAWKPSEAVDEIFKDVKAPVAGGGTTDHDAIAKARAKIVDDILGKYASVAGARDDASEDEAHNLETLLVRALGLERRLQARQTSEAPESPAEKFVIVFTADPDEVFDTVAGVVERQESEGAILKVFDAVAQKSDTREKDASERAAWLWSSTHQTVPGLAVPADEYKDDKDLDTAVNKAREHLENYRRKIQDFLEAAR